jgi:hypothetical protein
MKPLSKPLPQSWKNYGLLDDIKREHVQTGLIDTLGNYCSYCEMPLGGYEVEHHKHAKTWKENVKLDEWRHLLLICKDCREHIEKETLSEEEMVDMLWPDEHTTFALHDKSPFKYEQRDVRYLVLDGDNVHTDKQKKLVFIVANPMAGEETYRKARNTINHFQLNMNRNYHNEGSNTLVLPMHHEEQRIDSRVFERTTAWNEAEAAINRMKQMDDHPDIGKYPEIKEMLLDQISATAFHKGNWSIWMTVFNNRFPDNHNLLHRLFIKDERYFKGIHLENLGLKLNS